MARFHVTFSAVGISFVQKSDLTKKKTGAKTALVLAGGAVTGGVFKVAGLKALDDFLVNKSVTDFDIYVGLSAGAILAATLSGGVGPEEMLKSLDGSSKVFSQLSPFHFYYPNTGEYIGRPISYLYRRATYLPGILYDVARAIPRVKDELKKKAIEFIMAPSYSRFEEMIRPLARVVYTGRSMPTLAEAMPGGVFDNSRIERYMRENMERNHMPNNFKVLKRLRKKSLYIVATILDTSKREVFGYDEKNDVTISEAIQASTALPGFYKPVTLKGIDYVDGAIRRTANIDVAINKGADLIICYNPFRPFNNELVIEYIREEDRYVTKGRRLAGMGLFIVLNQAFRTLFHTRLQYSMDHYRQIPDFKGDIILVEPDADDELAFEMNPLAFWQRAKAAKVGFNSVRESIEGQFGKISRILGSYGIEMSRDKADLDYTKIKDARDDETTMEVLEGEVPKRRFRLVA